MEARIADLQQESQRRGTWYKEASVVVAILALIISGGSAYLTYRQGVEQDAQDARSELGQLIQRISDLSRGDGGDVKNDQGQVVARRATAGLDGERVALAQQAADLIRAIPDKVSAHECLIVAQAFYSSNRYAESREIAEIGSSKRADGITHPALYRIQGSAFFADGKLNEGRKAMQSAVDSAPAAPHDDRVYSQAYSEYFWAGLERRARACSEAHRHYKNARLIADLTASESYRTQLNKYIGGGEPACR
ncbi:hypothetical protein [Micromonospora sp. WMMD812]|uniref:hypothetical protein n=1 Tax=Micromonospora sp. WMMD812 TaxID=3015152 RepID=UPI00248BB097|nr:hypothetical protein [Micromonospora sp. WMMD812]WBB70585.1 hypothetical protein O7603_15020 [Micromonospora sp. WMMD812]